MKSLRQVWAAAQRTPSRSDQKKSSQGAKRYLTGLSVWLFYLKQHEKQPKKKQKRRLEAKNFQASSAYGGELESAKKVRRHKAHGPDRDEREQVQRIGGVEQEGEDRIARAALAAVRQQRRQREQGAQRHQHPA